MVEEASQQHVALVGWQTQQGASGGELERIGALGLVGCGVAAQLHRYGADTAGMPVIDTESAARCPVVARDLVRGYRQGEAELGKGVVWSVAPIATDAEQDHKV